MVTSLGQIAHPIGMPGGFRPQAQVASEAVRVINQAKALQASGCFAIVLECIPAPIAAAVTKALNIPTIGIGAGPQCSGQVRLAGVLQWVVYALMGFVQLVTTAVACSALYASWACQRLPCAAFLGGLSLLGTGFSCYGSSAPLACRWLNDLAAAEQASKYGLSQHSLHQSHILHFKRSTVAATCRFWYTMTSWA